MAELYRNNDDSGDPADRAADASPAAARPSSSRVQVRRLPERGVYDAETIGAILDEALICHVGFVVDGSPVVIPTIHARDGERLYVHGSTASRMLRTVGDGAPVCVTASIVDGLVLARSLFEHSMNYRSVVVFGTAHLVLDPEEKLRALAAVAEHIARGRWDEARRPNDKELRQTSVIRVDVDEASAKVREGPPEDLPEDLDLPIWAGVLPLRLRAGEAWDDPTVPPGVERPAWLRGYDRGEQASGAVSGTPLP